MKKFIIINKKKVFISRKKYNLLKTIDNRYYYTKKLDQKNKLNKSEKVIILGIYFKNYSLRKLASIRHTNAMAISRQRDKILKKLRKDLIKFDDYY